MQICDGNSLSAEKIKVYIRYMNVKKCRGITAQWVKHYT